MHGGREYGGREGSSASAYGGRLKRYLYRVVRSLQAIAGHVIVNDAHWIEHCLECASEMDLTTLQYG